MATEAQGLAGARSALAVSRGEQRLVAIYKRDHSGLGSCCAPAAEPGILPGAEASQPGLVLPDHYLPYLLPTLVSPDYSVLLQPVWHLGGRCGNGQCDVYGYLAMGHLRHWQEDVQCQGGFADCFPCLYAAHRLLPVEIYVRGIRPYVHGGFERLSADQNG